MNKSEPLTMIDAIAIDVLPIFTMDALLKDGADINIKDDVGRTPFMLKTVPILMNLKIIYEVNCNGLS